MKEPFTLIIFLFAHLAFTQSNLPGFLTGTWKVENENTYEHWDLLNDQSLKGLSYKLSDGHLKVSEYLDITRSNDEIHYTATVTSQNQGKSIAFKLIKSDSTFTFENPNHDFPKQITYQKLSDSKILVKVSDGKQKGFQYKMRKQTVLASEIDTSNSNPNYNESLARRLGADEYGMKSYFFVILKTGPNTTKDQDLINENFRGHLANINRLVTLGNLIVAGPLGKNDNQYKGIFIFDNVTSIEEANTLLQSDPAIESGLLEAEVYPWYGSAALPEYLPESDKIWKSKP